MGARTQLVAMWFVLDAACLALGWVDLHNAFDLSFNGGLALLAHWLITATPRPTGG